MQKLFGRFPETRKNRTELVRAREVAASDVMYWVAQGAADLMLVTYQRGEVADVQHNPENDLIEVNS